MKALESARAQLKEIYHTQLFSDFCEVCNQIRSENDAKYVEDFRRKHRLSEDFINKLLLKYVDGADSEEVANPKMRRYSQRAAKILQKVFKIVSTKQHKLNEELVNSARYGDIRGIQFWLNKGADINGLCSIYTRSGEFEGDYTPLKMAIEKNEIDAVKYLVEHGADVNSRDTYGFTPLHNIVKRRGSQFEEYGKNIQYLVEHGADINARTLAGETPLDFAESDRIRQYLISKGAVPGIKKRN